MTDFFHRSFHRFFHKKSSKNCPSGGVSVFECEASAEPSNFCEKFASTKCPPGVLAYPPPEGTDERRTVFDQTFVKSLVKRS